RPEPWGAPLIILFSAAVFQQGAPQEHHPANARACRSARRMTVNTNRTASLPDIVLSESEHASLMNLASEAEERLPGVGEALLAELDRAAIVASQDMPDDIVRMGSSVLYRSDDGAEREVRLVYPAKADIAEGLISVMTPIGGA